MYGVTWSANNGIDQCFKEIAKDILAEGMVSSPRGKQTKQCIGATIIMDPNDTMLRNKQRKLNYVFALVQKIVYTSGNGLYAGILDWYNSNYSYYEDGVDIGNYCWRIAPQLRRTVELLQKDPDSRQAVIAIYNNLFDQRITKDTPCTLSLQFLVRNGRLDMIATMRSNDLLWGFSYDINQFSFIQKLIAMFLGIPTGIYVHHSNSLHIYDYSYEEFEKIIICNEYYTEKEQPDLIPTYDHIADAEDKMDQFFKDCELFWKIESLMRFGIHSNISWVIDRYGKEFESTFFQYALGKTANYNGKKLFDQQHLDKYFKHESCKL